MPKKTAARHSTTQQRPQPKRKDVTLVRATSSTEVVTDDGEEVIAEKTETVKAVAPKTKPVTATAKTAASAASTAAKRPATATKPNVQTSRALAARRGQRPGQRPGRPGPHLTVGRQANLVTAEHYRYVLKDLRLIGILAFCAFSIIVALTFILPHLLSY